MSAGLLVALAVLCRLPLLPAPLTYGSDIWRQADTASIAHHFLHGGFHLLYPQIYWGGTGPGYVESEFQLYPFLVALLYRLFGEHPWLGRLVSLLFVAPTLLVFHRLSLRLLPARAALWALFFFAASPLYLRYSVAFMPEATVLCFYVGALYCFGVWLEGQEPRWLFRAALCTALSILVKPTSIHIGLIFLLLVRGRHGARRFLRADLWLFAALSLLPALLWYAHARGLYLRYGNTFGVLSGGDSKFGGPRYWLSPGFYVALLNLETRWLLAGFGWVPFLYGFWGLWRTKAAPASIAPRLPLYGLGTIFLYYLIVARYAGESWGVHYHLYALPFYALGFGRGMEELRSFEIAGRTVMLVAVSSTLFGAATLFRDLRTPAAGAPAVLGCAAAVRRVVPAAAPILVSSDSPSREDGVPNNYQDPVLFFYSDRHGFSLARDWHRPERVEEFRRRGARFLVLTRPERERELLPYLQGQGHGAQIGPGTENGCGIYELRP